MATKVNHLDALEKKGLRVVRKFNLCGYFEYHVLTVTIKELRGTPFNNVPLIWL